MTVRPRRKRLAAAPWGPEIHLALMFGPSPHDGPSDDVLRRAWTAYRAYLLRDVEDPANVWGYRFFDGPPELRPERPGLHPVPHDDHDDDHHAGVRHVRDVAQRPVLRAVPDHP